MYRKYIFLTTTYLIAVLRPAGRRDEESVETATSKRHGKHKKRFFQNHIKRTRVYVGHFAIFKVMHYFMNGSN